MVIIKAYKQQNDTSYILYYHRSAKRVKICMSTPVYVSKQLKVFFSINDTHFKSKSDNNFPTKMVKNKEAFKLLKVI